MKKNSLIIRNDLKNQLKILKIADKMNKYGFNFKPSKQDFNDIYSVMNGYINLYGRVIDYENRNK